MTSPDRAANGSIDKSPRSFQRSSWFLWPEIVGVVWLYYCLVVVCVAVPPFVVPALGWQLNVREGTAVTFGCLLAANVIALLLLWIWIRRKGLTFADLGWGKPTTWSAMVISVAAALAYASFTLLLP